MTIKMFRNYRRLRRFAWRVADRAQRQTRSAMHAHQEKIIRDMENDRDRLQRVHEKELRRIEREHQTHLRAELKRQHREYTRELEERDKLIGRLVTQVKADRRAWLLYKEYALLLDQVAGQVTTTVREQHLALVSSLRSTEGMEAKLVAADKSMTKLVPRVESLLYGTIGELPQYRAGHYIE